MIQENRQDPTPAEQAEFDEIWEKVLEYCKHLIDEKIGHTRNRFTEYMGSEDKVNRYYEMRNTLKVKLKYGDKYYETT